MNKIKSEVVKIQEAVTSATFAVSCKAQCNGASIPIQLSCAGIEAYAEEPAIISGLRVAAAVNYIKALDPAIIVETIDESYPEACIAWAISIMWFAFSTGQGKEHEAKWNAVFQGWKGKYSIDYNNAVLKDKLLNSLGIPQEWIDKKAPAKGKIAVKVNQLERR